MKRWTKMRCRAVAVVVGCLLAFGSLAERGHAEDRDPLAVAFGSMPSFWGVRISPDGSKFSFLTMHSSDRPIAGVHDTKTKETRMILASEEDRFDVYSCDWANAERLLCRFYAVHKNPRGPYTVTRLVGVDADGGNMKVLMQRELEGVLGQFQDQIIDWLPDEPKRILIEMPDKRGTGVSRLDIYSGRTRRVEKARGTTYRWMSDGRGQIRLRYSTRKLSSAWHYRLRDDRKWRRLYEWDHADVFPSYEPLGFGDDANKLLVLKPRNERMALWSEDLANERHTELVFAHDEVDVGETYRLGKYRRIVAVEYSTDRSHLHFFDAAVEKIRSRLLGTFPGYQVSIIDESWDRRFYLVFVSSDREPGIYYRFDTQKSELVELSAARPLLRGMELAPMTPIRYSARDGTEIPGYLTRPPDAGDQPLPTVILPHGGPHSRDYWEFDWLAHYFAARGYAVLQSNYRGSAGFGSGWQGEGAWQGWEMVVNDITDGAQYLIDSGISDPDRVCVVGWSYGGYAALLSAVEEPDRYRCVISVAGVSDPRDLARESRRFIGYKSTQSYIGTEKENLDRGSPARRAKEFTAPVLLFHGDEDVNVTIDHSERMDKALRRAKKDVTFIEYEEVDHQIFRSTERIDMLERIGAFLDEHTKPKPASEPAG